MMEDQEEPAMATKKEAQQVGDSTVVMGSGGAAVPPPSGETTPPAKDQHQKEEEEEAEHPTGFTNDGTSAKSDPAAATQGDPADLGETKLEKEAVKIDAKETTTNSDAKEAEVSPNDTALEKENETTAGLPVVSTTINGKEESGTAAPVPTSSLPMNKANPTPIPAAVPATVAAPEDALPPTTAAAPNSNVLPPPPPQHHYWNSIPPDVYYAPPASTLQQEQENHHEAKPKRKYYYSATTSQANNNNNDDDDDNNHSNWLNPYLCQELACLPKPNPSDTTLEWDQKFQHVFSAIQPAHRPFYNIEQFYQFVTRALVPWGYMVRLDEEGVYVHCCYRGQSTGANGTRTAAYDIHFNFQKKTYQVSLPRPGDEALLAATTTTNNNNNGTSAGEKKLPNQVTDHAKTEQDGDDGNDNNNNNNLVDPYAQLAGAKTMFDIQWKSIYEKLRTYKEKFGNCNVPTRGYEDAQLAKWVSRQRESYNKGLLPKERIEKLNELEFAWRLKDKDTGKGGSSEETWMKHYSNLIKYKEKHGNTHVPTRNYEDPQLAKWVSRQRECHTKGVLSQHRIDKLNAIDFSWRLQDNEICKTARENYSEIWMRHFERLKKFKEHYGDCNVPTRYGDAKLAKWVVTQREYYNKKTLAQDRIDMLNSVGFIWRMKDKVTDSRTVDCDANWKRHYHNLIKYNEKHGNTHVPTRGHEDPSLAKWVVRQRECYNKGILSKERIELLNSIGFTWRLKAHKRAKSGATERQASTNQQAKKKPRTTRMTMKNLPGKLSRDEKAATSDAESDSEAATLLTIMRNSTTTRSRKSPGKSLPTRGDNSKSKEK